MPQLLETPFPEDMREYAESAILRLSSAFLELTFSIKDNCVIVSSDEKFDRNQLRKEILNGIYREAIFQRTSPIRTSLFGA